MGIEDSITHYFTFICNYITMNYWITTSNHKMAQICNLRTYHKVKYV